jgi:hypothetical protein
MKTEKPILFSGHMVIKTNEDIKTVTRRIVKPQPPDYIDYFHYFHSENSRYRSNFRGYMQPGEPVAYPRIKAKYAPGDRLWVRETWGINGYSNESFYEINAIFKADNKTIYGIDLDDEELWERLIAKEEKFKKDSTLWRPSIFLPRAAARLFLDVKTVSIERLHELDDCEARLEGFKNREDFIMYWNRLNKKRGFPWKNNPWVYRIEYERVKNE